MAKKKSGGEAGIAHKVPMEQFNPKEHGGGRKSAGKRTGVAQPGGAGEAHEGSYNLLGMEESMGSHTEGNTHMHPIPTHKTGHFHGGHSGHHTPHNVEEY